MTPKQKRVSVPLLYIKTFYMQVFNSYCLHAKSIDYDK